MIDSKSLWIALITAYGGQYGVAAVLKILQDMLAFLQPQLLRILLSYISEYQFAGMADGNNIYAAAVRPSSVQGFAISIAMFVAALTQTVLLHQVAVL